MFRRAFRAFAVWVLSLIARLKFNATAVIDERGIDERAVFMCNHTSVWDFAYLINALKPRRVRFVATSIEFEKNRAYAWMLNALGVIKKKQGAHDAACVRNMLRACRAGDIVALYPSGMTSPDGRPAWRVLEGTGKLAKLTGVSVYAAVTYAGFISRPRYARKAYKGRVETHIKRLFTAEEAQIASADDIQRAIERELWFNDWDFQERARVSFRNIRKPDHVTRVLYRCPACGAENMSETKTSIRCDSCLSEYERDGHGFFKAVSGECPRRLDEWVDTETAELKREIQSENFELRARVRLLRPSGKSGYSETDAGELTLDRERLKFRGANAAHAWNFSSFQYFIMNDVDFLHIYALNGAFRFVFDDPRLIMKWFFAHRLLTGGEPGV